MGEQAQRVAENVEPHHPEPPHDPAASAGRRDAFPTLNPSQVRAVEPYGTWRPLREGEALFSEGDRDFCFYVVGEGEVSIVEHSAGVRKLVAVHHPGEFTGDVDMLTGRPAVVTGLATKPGRVLEVSAEHLRRMLAELPTVGDVVLRAFLTRRDLLQSSGFTGLRVVGSGWSKDTHRVREFLDRNRQPYTWIDVERDPQVGDLLKGLGVGVDETPVVVCGAGQVLRNPTDQGMAACLGLRVEVSRTLYDVAIVGAGPSGLAAAVYAASEGLRTVAIEASAPGGQAGTSARIENYFGFPTAISGKQLIREGEFQARKFRATITGMTPATGLCPEGNLKLLTLEDGAEVAARCVIVATGARYRKPDIANLADYEAAGVYYAATGVEAPVCTDQEVVLVGGGNSGGQAAMFLAGIARRVYVVIRRDSLGDSMSEYLVHRIGQTPNIEILRRSRVTALHGNRKLESVEIRTEGRPEPRTVRTPAMFVFIGADPHTEWLRGAVALDRHGFILTGDAVAARRDGHPDGNGQAGASPPAPPPWPLQRPPHLLETSLPGVFAAGDVRSGSVKRCASAVGEGAMAVQFVHAYLAG